jgi:hypothetical protein
LELKQMYALCHVFFRESHFLEKNYKIWRQLRVKLGIPHSAIVKIFFLNLYSGGWNPRSTRDCSHKLPAPGDYDDGELGRMTGRGNRSTLRKPAPAPLCPLQTPHAARTRTRAAAVGSQRLTAWATARPSAIVTTLRVGRRRILGSISGKGRVETGSRSHPVYYPMNTMAVKLTIHLQQLQTLGTRGTTGLLQTQIQSSDHFLKYPQSMFFR